MKRYGQRQRETDDKAKCNQLHSIAHNLGSYTADACTEEMVIDFYGLIAITPGENSLNWRRPDMTEYALELVETNVYSGEGPSAIPDFTLRLDVTFTEENVLTVIHTLIPDDNPECNYTFEYGGVFNWES